MTWDFFLLKLIDSSPPRKITAGIVTESGNIGGWLYGSKIIRSSNSYKHAKYNVDLIHTSSKGRLTMVVGRSVFFVAMDSQKKGATEEIGVKSLSLISCL